MLSDAIVAADAEGRIVAWNTAATRLLGWTADEARGKRLADLTQQDPATREAPWRGELVLRRKDGRTFSAHVTDEPVRGGFVRTARRAPDGARSEVELLQARAQLAHAEKLTALGMLVSGVAHEVRTPLAYIATNLHILQSRLELAAEGGASTAEALARVEPHLLDALQGVDRINRLVVELRRFQHAPATLRDARSLHEPVAAAVDIFRATSKGRATIEADLQPTLPARCDDGQVQQVVLNLLDNAADANPGGIVRIRTRDTPDGPALAVSDDGPGLEPDVKARMFEAFFTTKRHGTGLGLPIVQRIAKEHGATIDVETGEKRGTTFRITFPPATARGG